MPKLPLRIAVIAASTLLWSFAAPTLKEFVWSDLRKGMMSLRGLDRNTVALARLGFGLLAIMIVPLVCVEEWRSHSDLIVIGAAHDVSTTLAPATLLPLTLLLFVFAWSFTLAGAMHAHWAISAATLTLYYLFAAGWINRFLTVADVGRPAYFTAVGATAAIGGWFVLRRRATPRPAREFAVIFALVALIFLIAQHYAFASWRNSGIPIAIVHFGFTITSLSVISKPLFMLLGVDIAEFTRRASRWTTDIVAERLPASALVAAVVGLFAWRCFTAVVEMLDSIRTTSPEAQLRSYLSAGGEVIVVVAAYLWIASRRNERPLDVESMSQAASRYAFPLILLHNLAAIIIFLLLSLATAVPSSGAAFQEWVLRVSHIVSSQTEPSRLWLGAAAVVAAAALRRKRSTAAAAYLGTFGILLLWSSLTRSSTLLHVFNWRHDNAVEFWWTLLIGGVAYGDFRRARMTGERWGDYFFLLLCLTLMRQRNFIENPFSPLLGFAGLGFIAFALLWDMTTRGSWANSGTPALPRASRIFFYIGYILLAATMITWAVATHDLYDTNELTGGLALFGFDRFGKPLLYGIFCLTLFGPRSNRDALPETPAGASAEPLQKC